MATAEARNRWHRSGRRCYIHDCSHEPSKFSCSSSSSSPFSSSSSESDRSPDSVRKEPHNTISDYFSPYPNQDLSSGRQWWLKKDDSFARSKGFVSAHQGSSEEEFEILSNEFVCKELQTKDGETKSRGLKAIARRDPSNVGSVKDARDYWDLDEHYLMDIDSLNSLVSGEELSKLGSDFETRFVGSDKTTTEPWWRSSGKDDLASLVAQKSLEIENCDLPRPRIYRKQPSISSRSLDHDDANVDDDILASSFDRTVEAGLSNLTGSPHDSEQNFSSVSENDQSNEKLLRALCLSQKRAREAEKAAKQAFNEKEHIITMIFRQASQIFAYKQWIRVLQLENICLQLKNKNLPVCDLVPLPWSPRQVKKSPRGAGKKGARRPRNELCKCLVAFALGLGLAGAGLLLGWTMGWLFPSV